MSSPMNTQPPWALPAEDVLARHGGTPAGLSSDTARERLTRSGPNRLKAKELTPWYVLLFRQFANPLVYLLIGAALVKAFFKGPLDAAVIGLVLVFMAVIGFIQEQKAQQAMAALLKLSVPKARVRRDGQAVSLPAADIVPGDLLLLDAGDRIPADARILEAASLRVNESAFTGEAMPVDKGSEPVSEDASLHDRRNMVFMGTTVSNGRATAVVTATGMGSELGRIAEAIRTAKKERTPLQKTVDRLGRVLLWVVMGACGILALIGLLQGVYWVDVLLLAVAAAVAGIPEGLPAAVTVVLSICVNRMAGRNVIIRKLTAVETLGSTTVICSDKTGTLTLNQMTVDHIWLNGRLIEITGTGYAPEGDFLAAGSSLGAEADPDLTRLLRAAALCNDALLNRAGPAWDIMGDPTEGALLAAAGKAGLVKHDLEKAFPRLGELPFESDKQYMATLHAEGGERIIYIKGSLEKLLSMSSRGVTADGEQPLTDDVKTAFLEANASLAEKARRVLAVAYAPYPLTLGRLSHSLLPGRLVLLGLVGMADPPREEARTAVQACTRAGIRVAMITGDNPLTAASIAAQLGIGRPGERAVTGREIEAMSDDELLETCRRGNVYARIEPLHKLRIVNAFKRDGHITAMTGDGVNDAPALEAASIGVSMGKSGTDVAREASDMVLADDNFASLVAAVEEGRIVFNRLRNVVFFLLMTCAAELLVLLLSFALYGESPLEPIQILWINLVTGAMVAIPLGLEPGTGRELEQPPRDARVGLVFPGMLIRLCFTALVMGLSITWIFHHAPIPVNSDPASAHAIRQTIAFTGIVVFEWLFALQARAPEEGLLKVGFFRNPWLLVSMTVGLGLQLLVVYLPPANALFRTHPLIMDELWWVLLPGGAAAVLEGLRKMIAPRLFSLGQWRPAGTGRRRKTS